MITVMLQKDSRKNKQLVARPNVILFSKALFCALLVLESQLSNNITYNFFTIIKITKSF